MNKSFVFCLSVVCTIVTLGCEDNKIDFGCMGEKSFCDDGAFFECVEDEKQSYWKKTECSFGCSEIGCNICIESDSKCEEIIENNDYSYKLSTCDKSDDDASVKWVFQKKCDLGCSNDGKKCREFNGCVVGKNNDDSCIPREDCEDYDP
ncbi:MAG: hypothetical protein J6A01_04065, partial [Proteobacteria bacterium]|nr:hypothetical protein [Pseudomonadota bacterium]